jgi:glucose-6-phosphate 1-epimerase
MANEQRAEDLQKQFGIPNALKFETAPGGLVRAVVSTPEAEGDVYLQGAHVAHWTPAGSRPVLFMSPKSLFAPGKAIRGGVPLIFPWFGARGDGKPGPAHGFARTMVWEVENTKAAAGKVTVGLVLKANDATRALGYGPFTVRFSVSFGTVLEMELETHNEAASEFVFEEALHSYFAIGDIDQASVTGLEGTTCIDKTDGFKRKQQDGPVHVAKETDQVHLNTKAICVVHDPAWKRRIVIDKSGSDSTVVWNPGKEKTAGMADMAPGDWHDMICVETTNAADNAVHLAAGATHKMRAVVKVEGA